MKHIFDQNIHFYSVYRSSAGQTNTPAGQVFETPDQVQHCRIFYTERFTDLGKLNFNKKLERALANKDRKS